MENIGTKESIGNYATGLSPNLFAVDPTVRNVQEVEIDPVLRTWESNALPKDFVQIDLNNRIGILLPKWFQPIIVQ